MRKVYSTEAISFFTEDMSHIMILSILFDSKNECTFLYYVTSALGRLHDDLFIICNQTGLHDHKEDITVLWDQYSDGYCTWTCVSGFIFMTVVTMSATVVETCCSVKLTIFGFIVKHAKSKKWELR